MKENNITPDDENQLDSDAKATIGQALMIERINQKLSQQDIAEQLHLKLSVIECLEDNEPVAGLPQAYLRGYQRSYARLLGLNETQVMGEVNFVNNGALKQEDLQSINLPMNVKNSHWGRLLMAIILATIVAAAIGLWPWLQKKFDRTLSNIQLSESQQKEIAQPTTKSSEPTSQNTPSTLYSNAEQDSTNTISGDAQVITKTKLVSNQAGAQLNSEALDADKTQTLENANQSIAMQNTTTQAQNNDTSTAISATENVDQDLDDAQEIQAINTEQNIMFISNAESWLEVFDDTQTKLYSGVLRLDRVLLKGKLPLKVKVGNLQVMRIAYDDGAAQKVDIFSDSKKVAQFIVDLDEEGSLRFSPK